MEQLGERIRTERIAKGYSLKSAAEGSGIARDTWRKIEAGGSVHDTKRHIAMEFLGISERNQEWGSLGELEDHAADLMGPVDLNLLFSQAVTFTSTVGVLVPGVRSEAERLSVSLSELFARALQVWDRVDPLDRIDLVGEGDGLVDLHVSSDSSESTAQENIERKDGNDGSAPDAEKSDDEVEERRRLREARNAKKRAARKSTKPKPKPE